MSVDVYSRLISEKPKSRFIPNALMRRASAFYNLGNFERSVEDYLTILNKYSQNTLASDALLPLQDVLTQLNRSSEFDKYLADYKKLNPDHSGLEEVEFESLKIKYFNQDYQDALDGFTKFIEDYPEDPRGIEARYYIGDSYFRLEMPEESKSMFEELLDFPAFWRYPSIVERIAGLEFDENNYDESIKYFDELLSVSQNKRQINVALSGKMMSYYNLSKYDSAIQYAESVMVNNNVDVSSQNKASLYLGKSYYAKGNYEKAKDEFLNTLNSAKDVNGAEAQYLLGEIFYLQKSYKQSIDMLINLNTNFQSFQHWVGEGFLLISDNYVAMEDYFQARGTLNSLIEYFPDEVVKERAAQKLIEIDAIEAKIKEQDSLNRAQVKTDSLTLDDNDSIE